MCVICYIQDELNILYECLLGCKTWQMCVVCYIQGEVNVLYVANVCSLLYTE